MMMMMMMMMIADRTVPACYELYANISNNCSRNDVREVSEMPMIQPVRHELLLLCRVCVQWDKMLNMIGRTLEDNGIPNVFVKGNVYVRNRAVTAFKVCTSLH